MKLCLTLPLGNPLLFRVKKCQEREVWDMDKMMTSGEIAKKTGVSQKAIRFYDEKGLLKPSELSQGNYRLYDKEALVVLEKIIALKQIGFSLEEIHDSLDSNEDMDIRQALVKQLEVMETKKQEIERVITCIKGVLLREKEELNWDSVSDIVKIIHADQEADRRHWVALARTTDEVDWYVRIYQTLHLEQKSKVLDLGCGFAKLWRNNWKDIPTDVQIDAYDVRGSWADDFEKYVAENKEKLADGTTIHLYFEDIEADATWERIEAGSYQHIISHYVLSFLKDRELLIQRAANALSKDGVYSCNGCDVTREDTFWKTMFEDMNLKPDFAVKKAKARQEKQDAFIQVLQKYFSKVENVKINNEMKYDSGDDLFECLCQKYSESKKYFMEHENKIKAYFEKVITEQGEILVPTNSDFQKCYK